MRNYRLISTIIVLFSIIFLPYWVYLPLLLAAMIVFPIYWEAIIFALLIDVLYGEGIQSPFELLSPMAFTATLLLMVLMPVRERIRINA